ncbi:MAG: carboxypeptidase regulatory-like domain-containing protein, partial [Deltaproteobacteria bacterium]|nr:carboxypeptidase regulatory-like domain-containing protein [Deltaproteobacteria bacterium]
MHTALRLVLLVAIVFAVSCNRPTDDGFSRSEGDDPVDGEVTGRICAPSGDAVFGADVVARTPGLNDVEEFTDESGRFIFANLPSGLYSFEASKGSYSLTFELNYTAGTQVDVGDNCLDPSSVRIAVVTGFYDSIGDMISSLGLQADVWSATDSDEYQTLLMDPDLLADYDVIFFNCGMSESWGGQYDAIGANLDEYVRNGGNLYVSDLAFPILEAARPDFLDMAGEDNFEAPRVGMQGTVLATVLDPVLSVSFGGRAVEIDYDLSGWA